MGVGVVPLKELLEPNEQTIRNHKWQAGMWTKNLWAKLDFKEN